MTTTPTREDRVDQTIFVTDPRRPGNCVAACVATLVGEPIHRVPHFIEFGMHWGDDSNVETVSAGNAWWAMMLGYLAGRGLWVVELDTIADAEPGEFLLVAGMSPRGVMHQVIYRDGALWHDPHPSRDGVLDVREVLAVRPLPEVGFDHQPTDVDARACRDCGCTDTRACDPPCWWVEQELCSTCRRSAVSA